MNLTVQKSPAGRSRTRKTTPAIGCEWCVGLLHITPRGGLMVLSGAQKLKASRAASCLLEPASGDSVACLRVAPNEVWIMSILQREEGVANVVNCAGDMRIAAAGGTLALDAARVGIKSDDFDLSTGNAAVAVDTGDVVGRQLRVVGSSLKIVGSVLSSVLDRVQHFSKSYLRTTEGIDRVSATHVEIEAQQLMRLEGEHALINGRELIKARGAQIHFG